MAERISDAPPKEGRPKAWSPTEGGQENQGSDRSSVSTGAIPRTRRHTRPSLCDTESLDLQLNLPGTSKNVKILVDQRSKTYGANRESIIEYEVSLPRERKKWHRPPLVGQASGAPSSSVLLAVSESRGQEQEESMLHDEAPVVYEPAERDVELNVLHSLVSDRYVSRSVHTSELSGTEHNESARAPSPASVSSAASGRPLEWDSGADVGYQFQQNREEPELLSTLERMALGFMRTDPEGSGQQQTPQPGQQQSLTTLQSPLVTGPPNQQNISTSMHSLQGSMHPLMQSTPINVNDANLIIIPPLNLDALTSKRDHIPKKYGSLDSLNTRSRHAKHHRSSSRSSLSKKAAQAVPQTGSASSSSVATVVSKDRAPLSRSESSDIESSERNTDTGRMKTAIHGDDLMEDLTRSVELLKNLMVQAGGPKAQKRLIKHVINQLTGMNYPEDKLQEPVQPVRQQIHKNEELEHLSYELQQNLRVTNAKLPPSVKQVPPSPDIFPATLTTDPSVVRLDSAVGHATADSDSAQGEPVVSNTAMQQQTTSQPSSDAGGSQAESYQQEWERLRQQHQEEDRVLCKKRDNWLQQEKEHQKFMQLQMQKSHKDQQDQLKHQQQRSTPRDGQSSGLSVTSSQASRKSVSSGHSQQVSSCHSQRVSTSERPSWSSSHAEEWQDNQTLSSQRLRELTTGSCDEPAFLSFLESQAEQERLDRAIWISSLIESLQRRKQYLLNAQSRSRESRDKKKLEGDGRSRSGSESSSQPHSTSHMSHTSRVGASHSACSSNSKAAGLDHNSTPPYMCSKATQVKGVHSRSSEIMPPPAAPLARSKRTEHGPDSLSHNLNKPTTKSQGTQYEHTRHSHVSSKPMIVSDGLKKPLGEPQSSKHSVLYTDKSKTLKSLYSRYSHQNGPSTSCAPPNVLSQVNLDSVSAESLSIRSSETSISIQESITKHIETTGRSLNCKDTSAHSSLIKTTGSKHIRLPGSESSVNSLVSAPVVNRDSRRLATKNRPGTNDHRHSQANVAVQTSINGDDGDNSKENVDPKSQKLFFNVLLSDDKTTLSGRQIRRQEKDISLQESLLRRRPAFVRHANSRRECLAQLTEKRQVRAQLRRERLREQVHQGDGTLLGRSLSPLPPHPLAEQRLFTQKVMEQQTMRKVKQLGEVQLREQEKRRKQEYETNRQMAAIFGRKLQRRALIKQVNLSNSVSVISSD